MKLLKTLKLEDKGQDFLELRILSNGVIKGYSPMFSNDRLSLLGIGNLNGKKYYTFKQLKDEKFEQSLKGLYIYLKDTFKNTGEHDPLPWDARTLNYKII
jgi:hypothetical protein